MVKTEDVEDCGVEVVDVDGVFGGAEAEVVGGAVGQAALHRASRQPDGVAPRVVVAALALFAHRHAAELAAPDHQRVVPQAAALQVGEQRGDGAVGAAAHLGVITEDIVVSVPAVRVARVKLHEPDAPLQQSPREQTARAELGGLGIAQAVKLLSLRRLLRQIDRLGRGRLHAVGKLIRRDAGRELVGLTVLAPVFAIELLREVQHAPLL